MSVKKNFIYNLIYQILIMILPLVTAPYISRVLGDEQLGTFSYTYSIASYFVVFAILGLNNYGNRAIASIRSDKQKLSQTFWEIFSMQALLSVIVCGVYGIYVFRFSNIDRVLVLLQFGYVVAGGFDINWLFFGLEKFKVTVTRNVIIKIISVIFIFLFVKDSGDLYIYTIIMMGASVASQIVLWPFVKKEIIWVKPTFKGIVKHIKPNLTLFIPVVAVSLYKVMDKIMLGNLSNMSQVAYYEYGEKITTIAVSAITALGTVMLPQMSYLLAKGENEKSQHYIRKSMSFSMLISSAMAFGIAAIADDFAIWFYGEQFAASGNVMKGLSITVIFISCANVIRTQYLIPAKKDKTYIYSVILGAVCNLIINYLLIPHFAAMGAVIGTIAAEFVVMMYQLMAVRKELPIFTYFKEGYMFVIIGVVMFVCVSVVDNVLMINMFSKLLCEIVVGVVVYMTLALLYTKRYNDSLFRSMMSVIPRVK